MTKNLIIICVTLLLVSCSSREKSFKIEWLTMGTFASCTVEAEDREKANEYFDVVKHEFSKVSKSFNVYNTNSVISMINRDAQFFPVEVSDSEYCIITNSIEYSKKTGTAFNPVCLPLIKLWGFSGGTNTTVPTKQMIQDAMTRVNISDVYCSSNTISFKHKNMQLDMGGVAKGYAVDMAYNALLYEGCSEFIVNLGGNLRVETKKEFLRIGIRDPYDKSNIMGALKLKSGFAVATSGDYERYVILDGVKYPHIIDPRTGYPAKTSVATTVVAPNATQTDILSTAVFVLGENRINDVVNMFTETSILLIYKKDDKISISVSDEDVFDLQ
jgi:thiamine biosynthesis lipoprotein